MKIILCGAGDIGKTLVNHLSNHYALVIIDTKREEIEGLNSIYDIQTLEGDASDPSVLSKSNLTSEDMVIACTGQDTVNLAIAVIAKAFFRTKVIVSLKNRCFFQEPWTTMIPQAFQIDHVIYGEAELTQAMTDGIQWPWHMDSYRLTGNMMLVGIILGEKSPILHQSLETFYERFKPLKLKIIQWWRKDKTILFHTQNVFLSGDRLYFLLKKSTLSELMEVLQYASKSGQQIVVLGASPIMIQTLQQLEMEGYSVLVVEKEERTLKLLGNILDHTEFLKGDPMNSHVLKEALAKRADHILCASENSMYNLIAAGMATYFRGSHCMVLNKNPDTLPGFGMGRVLHLGNLLLSSFMKAITNNHISCFYPLEGFYLVEITLEDYSPILRESTVFFNPDHLQVLAIMRKEKLFWETKSFLSGDRLILNISMEGFPVFWKYFFPNA